MARQGEIHPGAACHTCGRNHERDRFRQDLEDNRRRAVHQQQHLLGRHLRRQERDRRMVRDRIRRLLVEHSKRGSGPVASARGPEDAADQAYGRDRAGRRQIIRRHIVHIRFRKEHLRCVQAPRQR